MPYGARATQRRAGPQRKGGPGKEAILVRRARKAPSHTDPADLVPDISSSTVNLGATPGFKVAAV